jgi:nitroimidazol reductase NimA-like FMN-containing flavoprotein (pyridoxamine 5'-phosphate oxidase superfamily)
MVTESRKAIFHNVMLREMTKEEIDKLMQEATAGRLGTTGPDGSYIAPLSFVFYNEHIYFHCHHYGKKLENIGYDPRVCFQVDISSADTLNYRSVVIQGVAKLVADEKETMDAMIALSRKYGSAEKNMPKTGSAMGKLIKVYKIVDYKLSSKLSETRQK